MAIVEVDRTVVPRSSRLARAGMRREPTVDLLPRQTRGPEPQSGVVGIFRRGPAWRGQVP